MSCRDRRRLTGGFVVSYVFFFFQGSCLQKSLRIFISSRWPVSAGRADGADRADRADRGLIAGWAEGWAEGEPRVHPREDAL